MVHPYTLTRAALSNKAQSPAIISDRPHQLVTHHSKFLANQSRKLIGEISSVVCRRPSSSSTPLKTLFSETIASIKIKFYMEPLWDKRM